MTRARALLAPALLLLALLLGGSGQGRWNHLALNLLGALAIGVALWTGAGAANADERRLRWLIGAALAWLLLQLVPLPVALWSALPGRAALLSGYALLGLSPPALPIHLAPDRFLGSALILLVPLAVLLTLLGKDEPPRRWLVAALLAGALAGCLLGLVQVLAGGDSYYLYRFSAFGAATGFFANSNHMALLLLVAAPMLVALLVDLSDGAGRARGQAAVAAGIAVALLLALGILLNRGLAVFLLSLPVAAASLLIPDWGKRARRIGGALLAVGLLAGAGLLVLGDRLLADNQVSMASRLDFWRTGLTLLNDHWLAGTGLGAFPLAFHLYEDPASVTATYVNHAHNDWLELIAELGLPGMILLALFVPWWAGVATRAWRCGDPYARAATIATAAILLHSLVDFPLRTPAIGAVLAMALALMVRRSGRRVVSEPGELWPTRHWTAN